jgi:hypothetical protein
MQPHQKSAEAIRSGEEYPFQLLKNAGLTAIGGGAAAVGKKAVGSIIPAVASMLSEYIPENLSRKGLSKIDPRFKGFIDGSLENGYSYEDTIKFIGGKISKSDSSNQDPLKFFQTNYSNLSGALSKIMDNGQPLDAAAAILKNNSLFSKDIKKLEKETGKNFVDYVMELFGGQGKQMQQPETMQQMEGQPQQNAGVDAQLMAALDKILKM